MNLHVSLGRELGTISDASGGRCEQDHYGMLRTASISECTKFLHRLKRTNTSCSFRLKPIVTKSTDTVLYEGDQFTFGDAHRYKGIKAN